MKTTYFHLRIFGVKVYTIVHEGSWTVIRVADSSVVGYAPTRKAAEAYAYADYQDRTGVDPETVGWRG